MSVRNVGGISKNMAPSNEWEPVSLHDLRARRLEIPLRSANEAHCLVHPDGRLHAARRVNPQLGSSSAACAAHAFVHQCARHAAAASFGRDSNETHLRPLK